MKPRGSRKTASMHDIASRILYACGGDETQSAETVDAIVCAVETYLAQLTVVAARNAETPDRVKPEDVLQALSFDVPKHTHVHVNWKDYKARKSATGNQGQ